MISQGNHIITHCNWDTVFDDKPLAGTFQMQVSHWSKYHLQREITAVFDDLCPEGQTLKIKTLEIDLGLLAYDDFLTQLPIVLKEQLKKELRNLILYPKNGDKAIEIISESTSKIHLLRDFLLEGILSWNYHSKYGSVNKILTEQLQNNTQAVIDMITNTATEQHVRKRMAWQFKEASIEKIIFGLTPNNHKKIIEFSNEFIKIQEKETIVQTSTSDLKKNLWLWMLNYLFTDRGTIFNTVSFVRTTIQQIAHHFNLTYEVLLELIEDAIIRVKEYTPIQKGFVAVLEILTKELHQTSFTKAVTERQKENFWEKLTFYLSNPSERSTSFKKHEFNELIFNLSKTAPTQFTEVFLILGKQHKVWKNIAKDLIEPSLISIFTSVGKEKGLLLLEQISFLEQFITSQQITISKDTLWEIGTEFLIEHKNSDYKATSFLRYTIDKISKRNHLSKLAIVEEMIYGEIKSNYNDASFIINYKLLQKIYAQEITIKKDVLIANELYVLLEKYYTLNSTNSFTNTELKTFEKQIFKWISTEPTTFWKVIKAHPRKVYFSSFLPELIAVYGVDKFLKSTHKRHADFIEKLSNSIIVLITENAQNKTTLQYINNHLSALTLQVLLKYEKPALTVFITELVKLLTYSAVRNNTDFNSCVQKIFCDENIKKTVVSEVVCKQIKTTLPQILKRTVLEELCLLIEETKNKQDTVVSLLRILVNDKKTDTQEFKKVSSNITAYIFPKQTQIRVELFQFYKTKIKSLGVLKSDKLVEELLTTCFWNTLITYQKYKGDVSTFKKLFEKALLYVLPEMSSEKKQKRDTEIIVPQQISKEYQLTTIQLFSALSKGLENGNINSSIDDITYEYKTLFLLGLETSPKEIRNIIQQKATSKTHLQQLQKTIDFEQFLAMITKDLPNAFDEAIQAIQVLYFVVQKTGTAQITAAIEGTFWEYTVAILKSNATKRETLTNLVREVLKKLALVEDVNSIYLFNQLEYSGYTIPSLLKEVLVKEHVVFKNINITHPPVVIAEAIKKCSINNKLEALCKELVLHNTVPFWFYNTQKYTTQTLLNEVLTTQPLVILNVLRAQKLSYIQYTKLYDNLTIEKLVTAVSKLYPTQAKYLIRLQKLYKVMPFVQLKGISTTGLQEIVLQKIITAWISSNWKIINDTSIWNEIIWEVTTKKSIHKNEFIESFRLIKTLLPSPMQITLKQLESKKNKVKIYSESQKTVQKDKSPIMENESVKLLDQGVFIPNAGLVILNSYFLMLLERLGLVANNVFVNNESQLKAIHYLQYVVTGLTQTEESLLVLNKVLCGVKINMPIKESIEISKEDKELISGLIEAAISYWSAIGRTSANGFRGNWLVREGVLKEEVDRWELIVEKRAYDILLNQSPFSFSIIKLPWMEKPLHVNWPY